MANRERDWAQIQAKVLEAAFRERDVFGIRKCRELRDNDPNFDVTYAAYDFHLFFLFKGTKFKIGSLPYTVVDLIGASEGVIQDNVVVAKNQKGERKVLKRLGPDDAVYAFLNAGELAQSAIATTPNPRLRRMDNPWFDTLEYDFIPGITLGDYFHSDKIKTQFGMRVRHFLEYFNGVLVPLARGGILKGNRCYFPEDLNPGGIIVSEPQTSNPQFHLIDLTSEVGIFPYTDEHLEKAKKKLLEDYIQW